MADLEPLTRKEMFYDAILGNIATSNLPDPVTREEVYLKGIAENSGGGGTYADLPDKPSINNHTVVGEMTGADLGLVNSNIDMSLTVDSDGILNVVYDDGE